MDRLGLAARASVVLIALAVVGGLVTLGVAVVADPGGSVATLVVAVSTVAAVAGAGVVGARRARVTETRYW